MGDKKDAIFRRMVQIENELKKWDGTQPKNRPRGMMADLKKEYSLLTEQFQIIHTHIAPLARRNRNQPKDQCPQYKGV